jgi:hypothetical protein
MAKSGTFPQYLYHAVGVIITDGRKARIEQYNPNRPLKWVIVAKKTANGLRLAAAIGLRKQRPYSKTRQYGRARPETRLSPREWRLVLELVFAILRAWTEQGTSHWKESTFRVGTGNFVAGQFVNRKSLRIRRFKYPTRYHRPRALRVSVSRHDNYLLRVFRRLDSFRIALQQGAEMVTTLCAAINNGKRWKMRGVLEEFLPKRDWFILALLIHRLPKNYRDLAITMLREAGELSQPQEKAIRKIIRRGYLGRFESSADKLLKGNAIVFEGDRNGHTRFQYSLSLLRQMGK